MLPLVAFVFAIQKGLIVPANGSAAFNSFSRPAIRVSDLSRERLKTIATEAKGEPDFDSLLTLTTVEPISKDRAAALGFRLATSVDPFQGVAFLDVSKALEPGLDLRLSNMKKGERYVIVLNMAGQIGSGQKVGVHFEGAGASGDAPVAGNDIHLSYLYTAKGKGDGLVVRFSGPDIDPSKPAILVLASVQIQKLK